MEPLPLKTRRIYALVSFFVFASLLLIAAMYASGYRLEGFSLVKTGGIYVSIPISDATLSLNGEQVGKSGFLSKSFFIDDLAPGSYVVSVEAEDYYSWSKALIVEQQVVSDTSAFLVPQGLSALEVVATTTSAVSTTTRAVTEEEYEEILDLFAIPTTTPETIATSTPEDTNGGIDLFVEEGDVFIEWSKSSNKAPSVFCTSPSSCVSRVSIEKGRDIVNQAKFFRGGVVYETKNSGMYLAEIDVKTPRTVVPIYSRKGATFRISGNELYILDNNSLYVIEGF